MHVIPSSAHWESPEQCPLNNHEHNSDQIMVLKTILRQKKAGLLREMTDSKYRAGKIRAEPGGQ